MNFWEQFAITQASAALHALVRKYSAKYFTPEEQAATDTVLDAIVDLPQRVHNANPGNPPIPPGH